jgi:hypothetical protein
MCNTSFLYPALHPAGENSSTKEPMFPSTNLDALNEALGGRIVVAWDPGAFHKTMKILFLHATIMFSSSGVVVEHPPRKTRYLPRQRAYAT